MMQARIMYDHIDQATLCNSNIIIRRLRMKNMFNICDVCIKRST